MVLSSQCIARLHVLAFFRFFPVCWWMFSIHESLLRLFWFYFSMKSKTNHSYHCTDKPQVSLTYKVYFSVNVIWYWASYARGCSCFFSADFSAHPTPFASSIFTYGQSNVKLFIELVDRMTCLLLTASCFDDPSSDDHRTQKLLLTCWQPTWTKSVMRWGRKEIKDH